MCCKVSDPVVSNIVIFFRVSKRGLDKVRGLVARGNVVVAGGGGGGWRNFECVKLGGFSYTVFPKSGCVVGTGIPDEGRVQAALEVFRRSAGLDEGLGERLLPHRVTNGTFSGSLECRGRREGLSVCVCQAVASLFESESEKSEKSEEEEGESGEEGYYYDARGRWSASFRSLFFPGLCLRRRGKWGGGTVNLFNNGKYVLVGVKSQEEADDLAAELCALMRRCWTTLGGVTSCAWAAAS